MKKAVLSSLLTASALSVFSLLPALHAQAAAAGQIQLDPAEFADYDNAVNKQTTPQTQAPALEAYLTKYPKSTVKADVLQRLMLDYYQFDHAKAIDAADRVLQVTPGNPQALTIEVAFRGEAAQATTDPTAHQPAGMSDADFAKLKASVTPTFYSAIASDDMGKQDYAGAVTAYKAELAATPIEQTQVAGTALQDTYYLGNAYYQMKPADYVNCTFYTTRAASYAPDNFKAQLQPLATYCYKKYHGSADGYDAVVTAAKANLNPPAGFSIVPAPTNEDIVKKTIAETPDLATLALADKEFIIQYGKPEDADKVFATVKGKTTEIPDATVISATADKVTVAVSDDAVQSKTADFSYTMKTPLTKIPAVGSKVTLTGTYTSYTQSPLLITMDNGEEVAKKSAPAARKPAARRGK